MRKLEMIGNDLNILVDPCKNSKNWAKNSPMRDHLFLPETDEITERELYGIKV